MSSTNRHASIVSVARVYFITWL